MGEHWGNTSTSTKYKLQFYLQMPCLSLSRCLPSVKGISLCLSECLGKGPFHVSGTPGIKKASVYAQGSMSFCNELTCPAPGGREGGSGLNPLEHLAK